MSVQMTSRTTTRVDAGTATAARVTGPTLNPSLNPTIRPVLRLTRRGRLLILLALVGLLLAAFSLGRVGSQASTRDGGAAKGRTALSQVVVRPGESLWAVAERAAPGRDPRAVIDRIVDVNNLVSSDVQAGQLLLVPTS